MNDSDLILMDMVLIRVYNGKKVNNITLKIENDFHSFTNVTFIIWRREYSRNK